MGAINANLHMNFMLTYPAFQPAGSIEDEFEEKAFQFGKLIQLAHQSLLIIGTVQPFTSC